jgi:hypothetical protein
MNSDRRFEPEKLGLGLCEGYDKMGHALSKPYLRAELENQLKAYDFEHSEFWFINYLNFRICEGRANPAGKKEEFLGFDLCLNRCTSRSN